MHFLRQTAFHISRIIKTPSLIIMLFIIPFLTSGLMLLTFQSGEDENSFVTSAAIIAAEGNEAITSRLPASWEEEIYAVSDRDELLMRLDHAEVQVVYEIPEHFIDRTLAADAPQITIYSGSGTGHHPQLEIALGEIIRELSTAGLLEQEAIIEPGAYVPVTVPETPITRESGGADSGFIMASIMIMVFIMFNGPMIGADLVTFRKEQSLKRIVATPNRSGKILASFLTAYFVFFAASNALIMIILKQIGGFSLNQLGIVMTYTFALICFSLSMGLLIFRIFKNPNVAILVGYGISMGLMAIGFFPIFFPDQSILRVVASVSPLHWTIEGLDMNAVFPGVPIILALAAVLFTAGSFRLEDYVSN